MMQSRAVLFVIITLLITGCDLISHKKPEIKKSAEAVEAKKTLDVAADNQPLSGEVLAKVGKWTLTLDEFNQRLKLLKDNLPNFDPTKPETKEAVLNKLVRQQLMVKDAEDSGIGQSKEITDAIEDFRRTMLVQELANKLVRDIAATEADAQKYYKEHKEDFVMPVQWKVREIVLDDEATAKSVLVSVLQGGSFADIAKAQSKGKTAADGGLIKPFTQAPFPAMGLAIANLDAGGTSAVFKGQENKYYIVHVDEKKGGETKQFAEIKTDLISALTTRNQREAVKKHLDDLYSKASVQINKDLLGSSK